MRQVFRTLKAGPYTRALAYDPESQYLASMSADGTLQVWDISKGKVDCCLRRAGPKVYALPNTLEIEAGKHCISEAVKHIRLQQSCNQVDPGLYGRSGIAWHPDGGSLLAAPGLQNEVNLYERLSWSPAYSLQGPHTQPVNATAFAPNGAAQSELPIVTQSDSCNSWASANWGQH